MKKIIYQQFKLQDLLSCNWMKVFKVEIKHEND
jgi:hypothetical protein